LPAEPSFRSTCVNSFLSSARTVEGRASAPASVLEAPVSVLTQAKGARGATSFTVRSQDTWHAGVACTEVTVRGLETAGLLACLSSELYERGIKVHAMTSRTAAGALFENIFVISRWHRALEPADEATLSAALAQTAEAHRHHTESTESGVRKKDEHDMAARQAGPLPSYMVLTEHAGRDAPRMAAAAWDEAESKTRTLWNISPQPPPTNAAPSPSLRTSTTNYVHLSPREWETDTAPAPRKMRRPSATLEDPPSFLDKDVWCDHAILSFEELWDTLPEDQGTPVRLRRLKPNDGAGRRHPRVVPSSADSEGTTAF